MKPYKKLFLEIQDLNDEWVNELYLVFTVVYILCKTILFCADLCLCTSTKLHGHRNGLINHDEKQNTPRIKWATIINLIILNHQVFLDGILHIISTTQKSLNSRIIWCQTKKIESYSPRTALLITTKKDHTAIPLR